MDLVIGVVGMVVLAGIYVALGLADRGKDSCESCLLRGDVDGGCLACPESPETGRAARSSAPKVGKTAGGTSTNGKRSAGADTFRGRTR